MGTTAGPRALARARAAFLGAQPFDARLVRPPILASWTRSRERAVPLVTRDIPWSQDLDDETPLARAAVRVLGSLEDALSAEPVSLVLCDGTGTVLRRWTGDGRLERHLDRISLARGFSYAERHVGTNGIGTSLESGVPVRVVGHEHFAEDLEHLACAAVPVRHPVTGEVAGVVNLTCRSGDAGVLLLTTVTSIAEQIRQELVTQLRPAPRTAPVAVRPAPSPAWARVVRECAETSRWLVLEGEPGTGKTALAAAARPARVLDAAGAGAPWLTAVAAAAVPGAAVVLQHVDRLDDAGLRALTALLQPMADAPSGAARPWVVATLAPLPPAPPQALRELLACFPPPVTVPALRHRTRELAVLVHAITTEVAGGRGPRLTAAALDVLARLPWPGNLVELRQVLEPVVTARRGEVVDVGDLPPALLAVARRRLTPLEQLEREALQSALAQAHGSKERAARALGSSRATVYRKVRRYGLERSAG